MNKFLKAAAVGGGFAIAGIAGFAAGVLATLEIVKAVYGDGEYECDGDCGSCPLCGDGCDSLSGEEDPESPDECLNCAARDTCPWFAGQAEAEVEPEARTGACASCGDGRDCGQCGRAKCIGCMCESRCDACPYPVGACACHTAPDTACEEAPVQDGLPEREYTGGEGNEDGSEDFEDADIHVDDQDQPASMVEDYDESWYI